MHRRVTRRAVCAAFGLPLLAAIATLAPAPTVVADEPLPAPPPVYVTATPYVALPGYAGAYNVPQGYFVSITDPDPFRAFGCATGDASCSAPPRDPSAAPPPAPAPAP